jgi:serine/threonine protein kinase
VQLEPGAVIGGKYRVERVLGEGGMGIVFEARHDALGTTVAVKVLRDEILKDKEAVARFAREARAAAALRSPHAARVLDVGEVAGAPFMVMELLVGNDLGVELERRGPLPVAEALQYVVQACEAIAEAHSLGIVHRDLKPANLFLTGTAPRRLVKVLDFGISRFDVGGEARVTQTQSAFGTPLYMSPEAVRSAKHTDARSDVWSFGVILYELLTGLPPFIADTPTGVAVAVTVDTPKPLRAARPDVSEAIDAVISARSRRTPPGAIRTPPSCATRCSPRPASGRACRPRPTSTAPRCPPGLEPSRSACWPRPLPSTPSRLRRVRIPSSS